MEAVRLVAAAFVPQALWGAGVTCLFSLSRLL